MSQPVCFTCKARAAGNGSTSACSAYCAACQPADTRPQPRGSQCGCAACGQIFATLTDFDRHQERHPRGHPAEGVFTGRCLGPAAAGLAEAGGVWGTPEGNANRVRKAGQLRAARSVPIVI